jgi:hypothetical protein
LDSIRIVRHVLLEETGPESYTQLRASLRESHSLSNDLKMERMMLLPPLGDCKSSVMLVEMLEFCLAGKSATAIFAFPYLQVLPREIGFCCQRTIWQTRGPLPRRLTGSSPCAAVP